MRARGITALLGVGLAMGLLMAGCERVDVGPASSSVYQEDARPSTAVYGLSPAFFDSLASTTTLPEGVGVLSWEDSIAETLADGSLLQLPIQATFEPSGLSLSLGAEGGLRLEVSYRSSLLRSRVLLKRGSETSICPLDLDLKERRLELVLMPSSGLSRQPGWQTEVVEGLTSTEPVSYSETEPCSFALESLDWALISQRIDDKLQAQVSESFAGELRALVTTELGIPLGGLAMVPLETGFFAPRQTLLASWLSEQPPWVGAGFEVTQNQGLRAAFDLWLASGEAAGCAQGLSLPERDVRPVASVPGGGKAPSGWDYDAAYWVDDGMLHEIFDRLVLHGFLCQDQEIRLSDVLPELVGLRELELEAEGRLRLQPLSSMELTLLGPRSVELRIPSLRGQLYGVLYGAQVLVASWEGELRIEADVVVSVGGLRLSVTQSDVTLVSSERELLNWLELETSLETIVAGSGEIFLERGLTLALPVPLGRGFSEVEMSREESVWGVYLKLAEREP